jgi:hypothetical protein
VTPIPATVLVSAAGKRARALHPVAAVQNGGHTEEHDNLARYPL